MRFFQPTLAPKHDHISLIVVGATMFGLGFTFCHLWTKQQQLKQRIPSPSQEQSPHDDNDDDNDDDKDDDNGDDNDDDKDDRDSLTGSACCSQPTSACGEQEGTLSDWKIVESPSSLPLTDEPARLASRRAHLLGLLNPTPATLEQEGNAFAFSKNARLLPSPTQALQTSPGHYRKFSGSSAWPSELPQRLSDPFVFHGTSIVAGTESSASISEK